MDISVNTGASYNEEQNASLPSESPQEPLFVVGGWMEEGGERGGAAESGEERETSEGNGYVRNNLELVQVVWHDVAGNPFSRMSASKGFTYPLTCHRDFYPEFVMCSII